MNNTTNDNTNKAMREARQAVISKHIDLINAIRRLSQYYQKPPTQVQIARAMDLSQASIARGIAELVKDDAVEVQENPDVRTENVVKLCPNFAYFAGIHISSGTVRLVLLDFELQPVLDDALVDLGFDKELDALWNYDPTETDSKKSKKKRRSEDGTKSLREEYKDRQDRPDIFFDTIKSKDDEKKQESNQDDGTGQKRVQDDGEELECIIRALNHIFDTVIKSIDNLGEKFPLLAVGLATPGIAEKMNDGSLVIRFCSNVKALENERADLLIQASNLSRRGILCAYDHDTVAEMLWVKEHLYNPEYNGDAFKDNIAIVHLGIGVGATFIFNGEIYRGETNCPGEIGHFTAPVISAASFKAAEDEIQKSGETLVAKEECECSCGNDCTESNIRRRVFNASSTGDFKQKTEETQLKGFAKNKPARFALLKEYIQVIANNVIHYTNVGLLIFTGRLAPIIEQEIASNNLRFGSANNIARNACTIRGDVHCGVQSTALGVAVAAFNKCLEENRALVGMVKVHWKPLIR